MNLVDAFALNLLSPAVLFFGVGIIAGLLKSDLDLPESISGYLTVFLMMSIGFKGGVAIANTEHFTSAVLWTIFAGVFIGFLLPFIGYWLLRRTTKLDSPTAAAVAAHYGSISMVTFASASAFLKANQVLFAGYIVAIVALKEAPAILSGLFIAHRAAPETRGHKREEKKLSREIFTNGTILLLLGAFGIGWVTGQRGLDILSGFLVAPFQGFLCLFLMDMGLLVTKNLGHLRSFNLPLILFGFYMPLIGATVGLIACKLIGVDVGTGMLFIVLCASASYIAVPAAMRLALPEAKAAIYVPMSLVLTFPFNIVIGIPLYYAVAKLCLG